MTSNILSRFLPSASDNPSPYDRIQHLDQPSDASDTDRLDQENLDVRFQDQDLEQLLAEAAHSEMTTESTAFLATRDGGKPATAQRPEVRGKPKWMSRLPAPPSQIDDDDDVPESLLLDGRARQPNARAAGRSRSRGPQPATIPEDLPPPVPGPSTNTIRAQWRATRAQQRLHDEDGLPTPQEIRPKPTARRYAMDPKEKALWRWANVDDLDAYLARVYDYFEGYGIYSILLRRSLNLLKSAFAVGFSLFLTTCIKWKELPGKSKLAEITVDHCGRKMPNFISFLLWIFVVFWLFTLVTTVSQIRGLWEMHNFFRHLLDIPDSDIQTVSWPYIVSRLMALRDANPATNTSLSPENRRFINGQSKQRMDAQDIANRLMRRDNYFIALINKDILDSTVWIPYIGRCQFFTKTIEWNIKMCIMDFVFDRHGRINPVFLTTRKRHQLIAALRRRLIHMGIFNILWAPCLVFYYCVMHFFLYFTEYQKNPSELGARGFTPLAEWKFREFNELGHFFSRRKNMSYPYASRYLDQFPKDKLTQVYSFTAFVTGALAAVLGVCTLLDPKSFLDFQIVDGKTVIFFLGVLGAVYAFTRGAVPDEEMVLDPEYHILEVIECTHYCPASWGGRLHSDEVRREFANLYKPKIMIFLEEALSIILTPYILLVRMPNSVEAVVDFFKDFTVHVDGLGHICSFAEFNFRKPGENAMPRPSEPAGLREDYFAAKDNKNFISYVKFLEEYGGNPARGGGSRSTYNKRQFLPPPNFPGVGSHYADQDAGGNGQPSNMRQSMYRRTPRFGPATTSIAPGHGLASPMHSVLLDPHHQPSIAGLRGSPRHVPLRGGYGGPARRQQDPQEANEEEAVGDVSQRPKPARTSSKVLAEDSDFGDSWRTDQDAEDDDEVETGPGMVERAGVLGLLAQFQRAQAEGRGVGI